MESPSSPEFILSELAERLGGQLLGDGAQKITNLSSLEQAQSHSIAFLSDAKYLSMLPACQASAVLLKPDHADQFTGNKIVVSDPYICFAKLSVLFDPRPRRNVGVHPTAVVSESARISESASIGANAYIGDNVVIGDDCEIYPNVCIAENTTLGHR